MWWYKKINQSLKAKGQDLVDNRSDLLIKKQENYFTYKSESKQIYEIKLNPLKCSCVYFMDHAICKHIAMTALIHKVILPGLDIEKHKFIRKNYRKSKKLKATACLNMSE